jgi:RimJ/RimL family protein N-acetyltransferase
MDFEVRRLREADAEAYRAIRLEALEHYPEAFQATYESAADLPLEAYVQRLERYGLFGGFIAGELAGFVGFHRFTNPKISHKAILWGMYVREAARGTGVAEAMVEAVLDHARGKVEQILISVITNNERARHFYEKMGFEVYGLERRAFKIGDQYFDEEFRVRFLT